MRVLLFDIDGTMLNSGGAGQAAMEDALEAAFGVTAQTEGIPVAGRTDRAITTDMLRFHRIEQTDDNWSRFVSTYLSYLPKQLAARDGLILPGVVELLNQLSERSDCVLGLLTGNFRRGAELKLSHYELLHHFQFGGYGDHHHDRDDVAREAVISGRLRFNTEEFDDVWVLGDTPADVKCGRAIGAKVVAVSTGHYSCEQLAPTQPDYLFENFSDVSAVVRTLTK